MVSKNRIGIGFRIGKLEVVAPTEERKNGYTIWRCRCDCGGERLLDTRTLKRGSIRDCGCVTKVPPGATDLTGRRFGKLVAIAPTDQRKYGGGIVWRCLCDCDNVVYVSSHQLTSGYTKSCGCLSHPPLKDFGSMSIVGVEQKRRPKKKEYVARHMLLLLRCHEAQWRILLRKREKLRTP